MFEGKKVVINKALNQKTLPPWFCWGQSGDDKVTSHVSTDLQSLKNKLPEGRLKFARKIYLWRKRRHKSPSRQLGAKQKRQKNESSFAIEKDKHQKWFETFFWWDNKKG